MKTWIPGEENVVKKKKDNKCELKQQKPSLVRQPTSFSYWPDDMALNCDFLRRSFIVQNPTPTPAVWMHSLISLHLRVCEKYIWLSASCGYNTTVLRGLALREVLKDEAEVSQALFEWGQGEDSGLIGRVQLEDRQQPPAPGRTVGRGLEDGYKGLE